MVGENMLPRFEQFIRERQYLHNVTPLTIEWYKSSLRFLPCETPSQEQLNETVIQMRETGRKATGCNSVICAINAYLNWSGSSVKVRQLKEPQLVLPTFTDAQVKRLVNWSPKGKYPTGCTY